MTSFPATLTRQPQRTQPTQRLPSLRGLLSLIVPLALLIAWYWASQTGWLSPKIMPSPQAVWRAARTLWHSGELTRNVTVSGGRALAGLAIGGSIGLALGLLNGFFRIADDLLDSSVQMFRTIPTLALIPLVILWFGIGESAKVFLIAVGVFFPLYLNTLHGVKSVDAGLREMGRVYGLKTGALFWHIVLPGALPSILVGVRFALGSMWLTLIAAETLAAESGIGYMTTTAREFMQTDIVVVGTLLYALLGKLADLIARVLERVLIPWNPQYQGRGTRP